MTAHCLIYVTLMRGERDCHWGKKKTSNAKLTLDQSFKGPNLGMGTKYSTDET